jgi:hypothetical protein
MASPASNERKTEALVRRHFDRDKTPGIRVEEQASDEPAITKLLKSASKRGKGVGKPEFLVHAASTPGLLIVVECKAGVARHESADRDQTPDFAVDGVLHYARHLSTGFDVIAIAASGQTASTLRISTFRWLKGEATYEELADEHGAVEQLRTFADYSRLRTFDPAVRQRTRAELMAFSRDLHNYMRDYAKVSEAEKPLLVSGVLIALQDNAFIRNYADYGAGELAPQLFQAIERTIRRADIPDAKCVMMLQPYQFLVTHPELGKVSGGADQTPLRTIVGDIDEHVRPFLADYNDVDVLGQFYGEFLRYSGGDKKGLGIVLTPNHVAELFAKLANVSPTDTVLDTCTGTAGFLIAAMGEMDVKAGTDSALRARIRSEGLVGVEQQPAMFALAASNMILRGDGKANLYSGSCFDPQTTDAVRSKSHDRHPRPNVGLINPPYSQKGVGLHELDFIKHMLDCLAPGGVGIAIVPMGCAIQPHAVKGQLLGAHTLVAVMSMPDELFYPVGTVTCVMVFRAHQPHAHAEAATWFGYWKDDGFVKTKNNGRVDLNHTWDETREGWLDAYRNRREVPGQSILHKVTSADEWCAEAYMETDYAALGEQDFEDCVRRFALYCIDAPESESQPSVLATP